MPERRIVPPSPGLAPISAQAAVDDLLAFYTNEQTRFGTGLPSLDHRVGSPGLGEVTLVWARSSAGKSTFMLNVIANSPQVPTLVVNMEMPPRMQQEWLLSMAYDLSVPAREVGNVIASGPRHPSFEEVTFGLNELKFIFPNLHFLRPERPSPDDIRVALNDIADATGIKPQRVFVDHLGLMKDCFDYKGYQVASSGLKHLAMEEDVSMWVVQQTGRSGGDMARNDGHLPVTLSSGVFAGEADADFIYGMYRPEKDPKYQKIWKPGYSGSDYFQLLEEHEALRDVVVIQVIKNRIYAELIPEGVRFKYENYNRRLYEM